MGFLEDLGRSKAGTGFLKDVSGLRTDIENRAVSKQARAIQLENNRRAEQTFQNKQALIEKENTRRATPRNVKLSPMFQSFDEKGQNQIFNSMLQDGIINEEGIGETGALEDFVKTVESDAKLFDQFMKPQVQRIENQAIQALQSISNEEDPVKKAKLQEQAKPLLAKAAVSRQKFTEASNLLGIKGAKSTPDTDIDDFVRDGEISRRGKLPNATEEEKRLGLEAEARNKDRSSFKRPQAAEKESNKLAELSARIQKGGEAKETEATGKAIGEFNMAQYEGVVAAEDNIAKIDGLITHLEESDAITGLGADLFNNVERVKTLLGDKVASGIVTDTEMLDVMMGSEVFPLIKSLGIGARGLDTPAEREFLRKVMTGELSLNKDTLLRMSKMRRDIQQRVVTRWNERTNKGELDRFYNATGINKQQFNKLSDKDRKRKRLEELRRKKAGG